MEEFRAVAGWPYEVSSLGAIRRIGSTIQLKPNARRSGYLTVSLRNGWKANRTYTVHSLVASAFLGKRPLGYQINHKDGNKHNAQLSNLEYVTPLQNKAHAKLHGLIAKREDTFGFKHPEFYQGSRNPFSKLTESDVVVIRTLWASGEANQPELARRFGVSQANISDIVLGKRWQHVIVP